MWAQMPDLVSDLVSTELTTDSCDGPYELSMGNRIVEAGDGDGIRRPASSQGFLTRSA
jgi:hypothetical protein